MIDIILTGKPPFPEILEKHKPPFGTANIKFDAPIDISVNKTLNIGLNGDTCLNAVDTSIHEPF